MWDAVECVPANLADRQPTGAQLTFYWGADLPMSSR
jgi:hypothetical protein